MKEMIEIQQTTKPHVKYKLTPIWLFASLFVVLGLFFSELNLDHINQTTK